MQEDSSAGADQCRLVIPVEEFELPAVEVLLRCMYGGSMNDCPVFHQSTLSDKLVILVHAYRLADRLQACTKPFAKVIQSRFVVEDVTMGVLYAVYGLEPFLLEKEDLARSVQ